MNEQEKNLRKINATLGFTLQRLNVGYDEEEAEMFDELITSKVGDLPATFSKLFTELLEDAPNEILNMSVGELMDMVLGMDA